MTTTNGTVPPADTAYDPSHDYHALNAMLNLYDAQGRKVRSASDVTGGSRISLEGLTPGAYYARVYSEDHAQNT